MNPWIRLLRPKQWIKSSFVLAPLFFSGRFHFLYAWRLSLLAALAFMCVACLVYIINDTHDIAEDSKHPVKKGRPLASGEIGVFAVMLLGCVLMAATLFLMTLLPFQCCFVVLVYGALNLLYTFTMKRFAIIDVFFIAFFYVLRVLMGCYALEVTVSPWIIMTTFLLALFLGFGKRYHELGFDDYVPHKPNLQHYSRELLDRLVVICGGATLMTYAIYTVEVANRINKVQITYTTAFVAFGLFRYLQSIYVYKEGGEPETIVLRDKWQLANLILWLLTTLYIMF